MAIDGIEAPSPPSQSQSISHFGQSRHFYVAVDRMETLMDLLGVAGWHTCLPMVVCCSSRDELDAVFSVVFNLPYISFSSLETYLRCIATCLTADGVVINTIVGDEVVTLKSIEESSNLVIVEMPINVSEIL